jgi:hypothetical protein
MQCGRCAGNVFLLDTSSELDVHLVCAECGMPQSFARKPTTIDTEQIVVADVPAGALEAMGRLHR